MTIQEVKAELGVQEKMRFNFAVNADKEVSTEWLRAWDNDTRTDIHMHIDTNAALKADPELETLYIQKETRHTDKGDYIFARIVNQKCVASW